MLIRISSAKCIGIQAVEVTVEVSVSNGIGLHLVGMADIAVKESLLRTVTALQALGFRVPGKKIVINLAPADIHKRGSGYDVPIALGIIAASGQLQMNRIEDFLIMGELGLDGSVRNIPGAIPIVEMAGKKGLCGCILPYESALETSQMNCCPVYGVHTLRDVLRIVCSDDDGSDLLVENLPYTAGTPRHRKRGDIMDFSEIAGQPIAKRAMEIAAAGNHGIILIGPPGSGKSSLAKAMCRILPPMSAEEALQTSKIYSVAGKFVPGGGLMQERPFRAPHNSISLPALVGGGIDWPIPGEITLAHNGVLFLDEFLEIPKRTLEALRAPMEDKKITISRLRGRVEYPADFTLVAASNPCPCGYWGEGDRCRCTVGARTSYINKLSGPLIDRIDLQVRVHSVPPGELVRRTMEESSDSIARRVNLARKIQEARFSSEEGICCNSQMNGTVLEKYCHLDEDCAKFLEQTALKMGFSARVCTKIIKISRTIADLDAAARVLSVGFQTATGGVSPDIQDAPLRINHLAEAVSYRFLDKKD